LIDTFSRDVNQSEVFFCVIDFDVDNVIILVVFIIIHVDFWQYKHRNNAIKLLLLLLLLFQYIHLYSSQTGAQQEKNKESNGLTKLCLFVVVC